MDTTRLKKVTVIAEAVLEERLLREIRELGARGYSLAEVRGEGTRGVHASEWEGKNLQIETLVSPEVATRIVEHVAREYFSVYSVVVYVVDVEVVRGSKYG